jgi:hypothetical protein
MYQQLEFKFKTQTQLVHELIQNDKTSHEENEKLKTRIKYLESAIVKTLNNNRHLADGNDCTLIDIKNIVNWE